MAEKENTEPQEKGWPKVYALVLGFLLLQIIVYAFISNAFG